MCFYELNILLLDCGVHQASSCLGQHSQMPQTKHSSHQCLIRIRMKRHSSWERPGKVLGEHPQQMGSSTTVAALLFPLATKAEPAFCSTAGSNSTPQQRKRRTQYSGPSLTGGNSTSSTSHVLTPHTPPPETEKYESSNPAPGAKAVWYSS